MTIEQDRELGASGSFPPDEAFDRDEAGARAGDVGTGPTGERRGNLRSRLITVGVIVLILGAGGGVAAALIATAPEAERTERETTGMPVRVERVSARSVDIEVRAQGTVVPARQVVLQPEVTGRVVWMHESLVAGGLVEEGETLLRIDSRDYRAAVEQQQAQVESSRLQLQQEESQRVLAERQWALLGRGSGQSGTSSSGQALALREPQLRAARAGLRASQSGLSQARTNLARTTITAPFNAVVRSEAAELGQLVGPQSQVATLVGSDAYWIRVAVPIDKVSWIARPGENGEGATARVWQEVGESGRIERQGRVVRLLSDLDPVGRMARMVVEIRDPLRTDGEAERGDASGLPLFLDALAQVAIGAGQLESVVEIPRSALHQDRLVYLYGSDDRLVVRDVEVVWRRQTTVLVRGLNDDDELIVSRIPTPIPGTLLQHAASQGPETAEGPGGEGSGS